MWKIILLKVKFTKEQQKPIFEMVSHLRMLKKYFNASELWYVCLVGSWACERPTEAVSPLQWTFQADKQ